MEYTRVTALEISRQTLFRYILNYSCFATIAITALLALSNLPYYRSQRLEIHDSTNCDIQHNFDKVDPTSEPANTNDFHAAKRILAVAKTYCAARKFGEYCIKDLIALAYAESRFNCQKIGDGGMSFGCYQIHLGYHPNISKEQARDLNFAINWTLNRMVSKGYPKYRSVSLMAHNGTPNSPKTLSYLSLINAYREKYQVD
jgi:hypothetical protein